MRHVERARREAQDGIPRVLYIGFSDLRGGASIASSRLIKRLVADQQVAALELVNLQQGEAPWTVALNQAYQSRLWRQLRKIPAVRNVLASDPYGWLPFEAAYATRLVEAWQPDIIHIHNLHGGRGVLPLGLLPELARKAPIVWTLHDMWLATGHCAYSLDCDRWNKGCGSCPDLTLYPHIMRDRTAEIVSEKIPLLREAMPTLVSPSQWLADVMAASPATSGLDIRVIANGIDLEVFHPRWREAKRAEIGLGDGDRALMFAAETLSGDNRKGAQQLRVALQRVSRLRPNETTNIILMGGSGDGLLDGISNLSVHHAGFVSDPQKAAELYAAADVFVCPSLQDNLPNTLLEASGCGTASIVFDGSGSLETIEHGITGAIIPFGNGDLMGDRLAEWLGNPAELEAMGKAARERAERLYSDKRMAGDYLNLYREVA